MLDIALALVVVHAVERELVDAEGEVARVRDDLELDVHGVVPEVEGVLPGVDRDHVVVQGLVLHLDRGLVHVPELVLDDQVGVVVLHEAAPVEDDDPELVVLVPVVVSQDLAAVAELGELHALDVPARGPDGVDPLESVLAAADQVGAEAQEAHDEHEPREEVGSHLIVLSRQ